MSKQKNGSEDNSSCSSSDSSDQTSSEDRRKRKRRTSHTGETKGKKKEKRAKSKHNKKLKESHKKKKHKEKKKKTRNPSGTNLPNTIDSSTFGPQLPLMSNPATPILTEPAKRSLAPMTKEEYDKQQSVLRRVLDPETGRHRLVKGDGEIVEEIVSRERHAAINKLATLSDGYSFQAGLRKL